MSKPLSIIIFTIAALLTGTDGAGLLRGNTDKDPIHHADLIQENTPRRLQAPDMVCPVPESRRCTRQRRPVICGEMDCEYSNPCVARAAGYRFKECIRKADLDDLEVMNAPLFSGNRVEQECKRPEPGRVCFQVYEPVRCGAEEQCDYTNMCEAVASGYSKEECVAVDYLGDRNQYVPVVLETQSSSSVNSLRVGRPTSTAARMGCEQPDALCTRQYQPVLCGHADTEDKCEYNNVCIANAAGYFNEECVYIEAEDEQQSASVIRKEPLPLENMCPFSSADWICPRKYAPVRCGEQGCWYSNMCVAAEFWGEAECTSTRRSGGFQFP